MFVCVCVPVCVHGRSSVCVRELFRWPFFSNATQSLYLSRTIKDGSLKAQTQTDRQTGSREDKQTDRQRLNETDKQSCMIQVTSVASARTQSSITISQYSRSLYTCLPISPLTQVPWTVNTPVNGGSAIEAFLSSRRAARLAESPENDPLSKVWACLFYTCNRHSYSNSRIW